MIRRLCLLLLALCTLLSLCGCKSNTHSPYDPAPLSLKILCIGNSFSADTVEHLADIASALGVKDVKVANMYIGGCSIRKHYDNAVNKRPDYEYHVNEGDGWSVTHHRRIIDIVKSEDWDWISVQHGTADGSRYAEEESYEMLPALIEYLSAIAPEDTKIAFNMTWVGERNSHEELKRYGNNQTLYYNAIAKLTEETVEHIEGLDRLSPTGTAIQNARTADLGLLTRDGYHLSKDLGCYIAGLTFFHALTNVDVRDIPWAPDGVTPHQKDVAVQSAVNAVATPYAVTAYTKAEN